MSIQSKWEWVSIDRANDYNYNGGSYVRDNWIAVRRRISDRAYQSQLGEKTTALVASNGGVDEIVSAPQISGLKFDVTTVWTEADWIWTPSTFIRSGQIVYRPPLDAVNIPDSASVNVVMFRSRVSATPTVSGPYWGCGEVSAEDFQSGTFPSYWTSAHPGYTSVFTNCAFAGSTSTNLNGLTFTGNAGTFTDDATASLGTFNQYFKCASDSQKYEQRGVNWYTQEQVWRIQGAWRVEV